MSAAAPENKKSWKVLTKYQKSFDNSIALQMTSKKGLKPEAVLDFISLSQFSFMQVEQLLSKTMKTFNNYIDNNILLNSTISEKLLKLFSLYNKGILLFGSVEEFNKWIAEPAFGLGNRVPQNLLDTITGIELVREELTRIEFGDLA